MLLARLWGGGRIPEKKVATHIKAEVASSLIPRVTQKLPDFKDQPWTWTLRMVA